MRILDTKSISASDAKDVIATQPSPKFLFLFQGVAYDYAIYDQAVLQRDMARLERFYRGKGFFDAQARVARVLDVRPGHVRVQIEVEQGPPSINRRLTIVGLEGVPREVASAVEREATRILPTGKRFDEDDFKRAEKTIKAALTDRGYAFAAVDSQAEADIGAHTVDYGFRVTPGPRAVFGPITIVGLAGPGRGPFQEPIPEGPVRRAIDIRPGQQYSTAEIASATQALLDLQVFSSVRITPTLPSPPPEDHVVPLTVEVEPTRLRQVTAGGGLEIDEIKTDLHLVTGWEDHNFLGGLRDFRANFKPGVVLYPVRINNLTGPVQPLFQEWLRTELRQPGFIEARTTGFIRPQFNIFPLLVAVNPPPDVPVVGYRELKVPVGVDRTFAKRFFVSLDYSLQIENPFGYVGTFDQDLRTLVLSFPELVAHVDLRDDPVRPHEGAYFGVTASTAGGIFGGTASDYRVQPEARSYVPLGPGVTFATRASVGFLWSSNYASGDFHQELQNSPATSSSTPGTPGRTELERDTQIMYFRGFFSGGPSTNRGYPLLGVSPHGVLPFLNPATASQQEMFGCSPQQQNFGKVASQCFLPVGGFTLWELQNEVRFDVSGPLSATVFCDMSDVAPRQADIRLNHLHLSCGLGIAYDTPVGPIRVDFGYRVPPLQVLGFSNEAAIVAHDPVEGAQPTLFGIPAAIAVGIGQAY